MSKETDSVKEKNSLDKFSDKRLFSIIDQTRNALVSAIELELRQAKLNFAQSRILFLLGMAKKATVADLASHSSKKLHSVYALLSKMEKRGLVKRTSDNEDGKVYIQLTPKSRELISQINDDAIVMAFSVLSDEEKKQLELIMTKLRTSVRNLLGLDFRPPFLQ